MDLKVVHMDGIWFVERRGIRWSLRDVLGVAEWERFPVGVSARLDQAFESAHSCPTCASLRTSNAALLKRAEELEGALCRARDRDIEAVKIIMAVVGNSLLNDPIFERLLERARAFYENPALAAPCPHEAEARRLRELQLWIEKEGITLDDIRMLEKSERDLRDAVKWAIDYYPYADAEWFRTELRRRAGAK